MLIGDMTAVKYKLNYTGKTGRLRVTDLQNVGAVDPTSYLSHFLLFIVQYSAVRYTYVQNKKNSFHFSVCEALNLQGPV